jgi:hypothetical protein
MAADLAVVPDPPPRFSEVIRDGEGDIWIRHRDGTTFWCITSGGQVRANLEEIQKNFGPVQRAQWQDI